MARLARGEVFNPREVSVFHCINRCVRRCFLCGSDPVTGIGARWGTASFCVRKSVRFGCSVGASPTYLR